MTGDGTGRPLLTVTAFAAKQAIAALRKRDIPPAPLLRQAGLSDLVIGESNPLHHRVAAIAQARFLDLAAEAIGDSAFGLHLAGHIDPRDAGIFFYVGSTARDVREALSLYSRYCRIVNEAIRQKLAPRPGGAALEIEFIGLPNFAARHNVEFILGGLTTAIRTITGRSVTPMSVTFSHNRNSDLKEFERFWLPS
jgi:hypothetical protein